MAWRYRGLSAQIMKGSVSSLQTKRMRSSIEGDAGGNPERCPGAAEESAGAAGTGAERDEAVEASRASLAQAGITAIPFYRTVEFAKELDEAACAG